MSACKRFPIAICVLLLGIPTVAIAALLGLVLPLKPRPAVKVHVFEGIIPATHASLSKDFWVVMFCPTYSPLDLDLAERLPSIVRDTAIEANVAIIRIHDHHELLLFDREYDVDHPEPYTIWLVRDGVVVARCGGVNDERLLRAFLEMHELDFTPQAN
jgi:hypothetical protein